MRLGRVASLVVCVALAAPAAALNLELPGRAELTREVDRVADTYFLPTDVASGADVPSQELEGHVVRQAWRIEGENLTTLGLLGTIRAQLVAQGYEIVLDCTSDECGGFDFRFGVDVLPAPDMFVDLFDFRFLSAGSAGQSGADYASVLVSRAGEVGYVQLVLVSTDAVLVTSQPSTGVTERAAQPEAAPAPQAVPQTIASALLNKGHVILPDLVFATGSSTLEAGSYNSLVDLAAFLNADPARSVALVGHTDAVGALDGNVQLSQARAASVMARLMQDHGVAEAQLDAQGMGYLSPVASNTTPEGRRANRRVEAVLLNTQ